MKDIAIRKKFGIPLTAEPNLQHCNALVKSFDYNQSANLWTEWWSRKEKPCSASGGVDYKGRLLCHLHNHNIPCDICSASFPRNSVVGPSPCWVFRRTTLTYKWEYLKGKKPNTYVRIPFLFATHRSVTHRGEVESLDIITDKYWLCDRCQTALMKSISRQNRKRGLQRALEIRAIDRAKNTIKEVTKLLRDPEYKRKYQNRNKERE